MMETTDRAGRVLERLTRILPLQERQRECDEQTRRLHRQILRCFVAEGRIPSRREMACCVDDLDAALASLQARDLVTFAEDGEAVGAYPFTSEAREHVLWVNGHRIHAMCALDALAVGPMFGERVRISSRCRVSDEPVEIRQSGMVIENLKEAGDVRVGIDWGAADGKTCCADSLCLQMLYLKDGEIARQWLAADAENREVLALPEAVELASRFFVPLLR